MSETFIIIISIFAGLILSVLSNWFYDVLKTRGILPEKPTLKRSIIIVLAFSPFLILVALPSLFDQDEKIFTVEELRESGSWITIDKISPAPGSPLLAGEEIPVVVTASYYLSGIGKSTEINLGYLRRYSLEEKSNWFIIYFHPAEKGKHKVLLSGTIKVPNSADLNGEPFVVEASIKALDEIGAVREVASDEIIYEIVDT